jgi:hypothetical protein
MEMGWSSLPVALSLEAIGCASAKNGLRNKTPRIKVLKKYFSFCFIESKLFEPKYN